MKKKAKSLILSAVIALPGLCFAQAEAGHGGGNGGSDLEYQLKKRTLQIAEFVQSNEGKNVFRMLNPDMFTEVVNSMNIDVTTQKVIDKYGSERTCVNFPESLLVRCNLSRIIKLQESKQDDVITGVMMHEVLGLMKIELGHQENVSQYPISSLILPFNSQILSLQVSEKDILPMYSGLDSRSYGVTYTNKKTKESVRLICVNENIPINRCKNFSLVRKHNDLQSPVVEQVKVINSSKHDELSNIKSVNEDQIKEFEDKILEIKDRGFKYLTLGKETMDYKFKYYPNKEYEKKDMYRFGIGLTQKMAIWGTRLHDDATSFAITIFPIPSIVPVSVVDTAVEAGKQGLNIAIFPVKSLVNLIRIGSFKSKIKKANKQLELFRELINAEQDLSLVGTSKKINDEKFQELINLSKTILTTNIQ